MAPISGFGRLAAGLRLVAQRRALKGRSFNINGFRRWQVGDARITKVVELEGEGFGPFLLPDATDAVLAGIDWLPPGHRGPRGGLKLSVHSFVIEMDGRRILIDTNVGNGKRRKVPIWNGLSLPWLEDLGRAGFPPESIDTVVCTHLHIDHVGWNTRRAGARWEPTFPNARYVFVDEEYAYWRARLDDRARAELFADSIQPVVAAGLVDLVANDAAIAPGLRFVPTPGHTEFHAAVRLERAGQVALITGDAFHHPVQIAHPEWSSTFDTSPARSVETRKRLLAELAAENALILGTAFPDPSAGYVRRAGGGFRFEPVAAL